MVDLLSVVVGIVVGGAVAAVAMETLRRRRPAAPPPKLTTGWRLTELHRPVVVARDVVHVAVPPEAKVLASGLVDPGVQAACDVRQVPPVRAEFALDLEARRGLLFLGGLRQGSMALVTADEATVARLVSEFRTLWDRAQEYVERYRIGELGGRTGVTVETEGYVQDVLPWHEAFMVRLEDQGHVIGVVVDKDPASLKEQRIRVKGRLQKDDRGYPVLAAHDIRRLG